MDSILFTTPLGITMAVLAMASVGFSKGGFAGLGILGVPLLALVISPVQAAGILLPILLVSDAVTLWAWWGEWDKRTLKLMLPGALIGVLIGWATAAFVSDAMVRLIVGAIALAFVLRWYFSSNIKRTTPAPHNAKTASFWGSLAGYTSFVAHAGGPPYQVYTMPLNMTPRILTGTSVAFFSIINAIKVLPYFFLGQFDTSNLTTSAILAPLAVVFTLIGSAIIRRMGAAKFYPLIYAMTFMVALKLLWDGTTALL